MRRSGLGIWFLVGNVSPPWGGYGVILVSGMASRLPDGSITVERTGPFVPPITLTGPQVLLVTDAFRQELEASGLVGLRFREAVKKRIVRLDWRDWDQRKPDPERYPPENEPENYVLRRKHNPALAEEIGQLWEVVVEGDSDGTGDLARTWTPSGQILASEAARRWLTEHAVGWLRFEPSSVVPRPLGTRRLT